MIPAIDAELAGHADILDMKLQSLCGNGFSLFAVRILAKPHHFGVNWPKICKNKDGLYLFKFEWHNKYNGSYYCVILKIMIWHDATKKIKNKVFPFSLKKEQNLVSFWKTLFQMGPNLLQCISTFLSKDPPTSLTFQFGNLVGWSFLWVAKWWGVWIFAPVAA